jgi:glucosamine-6-phosphate deaminase
MRVAVFPDHIALARAAARDAASRIRTAVAASGQARIVAATGTSQMTFLDQLTREADLDWSTVELFHLDEYVGLPDDHPASFRKYLHERLIQPAGIVRFHLIDGCGDPQAVCADLGRKLAARPIDVAFVGIGENGHLAFNDPPVADFDDPRAVKVVALEEASRRQQVGEGHFATIADVPTHAITVTIPALLAAQRLLVVVPEARKAPAVRATLQDPVSTACPATILRAEPHATLFLDAASATLVAP